MLIGQYQSKLGAKRRTAIPKKFRTTLGKNPIITRWYEGCLVLISKDNWNALLDKLTGKQEIVTAPVRDTDRFIMGSAFELEPDTQGRVIIPDYLADYAELKEDLVFLGLGDRVELWDKNTWLKKEKSIAETASQLVEKLANE